MNELMLYTNMKGKDTTWTLSKATTDYYIFLYYILLLKKENYVSHRSVMNIYIDIYQN